MELGKDRDIMRMQVWVEAWTMTAQSSSCLNIETPTKYADECLKEFDVRFKPYVSE